MSKNTAVSNQPLGRRPEAVTILSKLSLHDGSVLIAMGSPDAIVRSVTADRVSVHLLGGGTADLPYSEIYAITLHRRPVPVEATPEPQL